MAREALRACMAGKVAVSALPEEDETEPGGMFTVKPSDPLVRDCSDRAAAALHLARMGEKGILPAVRTMLAEADEKDKKTLQAAVDALTGKP